MQICRAIRGDCHLTLRERETDRDRDRERQTDTTEVELLSRFNLFVVLAINSKSLDILKMRESVRCSLLKSQVVNFTLSDRRKQNSWKL